MYAFCDLSQDTYITIHLSLDTFTSSQNNNILSYDQAIYSYYSTVQQKLNRINLSNSVFAARFQKVTKKILRFFDI